jgi:YesN/AraC family two-component response regulator
MPEMNGLQMAEKIRKNNQETKIIVLSGYDKFEYAKKSISLNVAEYLLKPFGAEKLINVILRLIKDIKKEKDGENFTSWVNKYRITQAKKLIKENSEMKFYQIAEAVGFNDYKYFSTIFKKCTEITPSEYKSKAGIH